MVRKVLAAVLAVAFTLALALSVAAHDRSTTTVEVRVWQGIEDPRGIFLSARQEGGAWDTLGTIPLSLDKENTARTYRFADIILSLETPEPEAPADGQQRPTLNRPQALDECTRHVPQMGVGEVVTSDGQTRWRPGESNFIITIPRGINLSYTQTFMDHFRTYPLAILSYPGPGSVGSLTLDGWSGLEMGRETETFPVAAEGESFNISALLDRIVASVRLTPGWESCGQPPVGPPPELAVISDGATDSFIMEWSGGPEGARHWQYRTARSVNFRWEGWGAWRDVPNSGATPRSYRVTGLGSGARYDVQVRAVVDGVGGAPSDPVQVHTHAEGEYPILYGYQMVVGDGRTEWRLGHFVITIPEGVRVEPTSYGGDDPCDEFVSNATLTDPASGSYLHFTGDGTEVARYLKPVGRQRASELFNRIVESVRGLCP